MCGLLLHMKRKLNQAKHELSRVLDRVFYMALLCLQAQCFSTSYTETGLFGIQAAASHFDIGKVRVLFSFTELLITNNMVA